MAYRYWDEARQAAKTLIGIHGFGGNRDNYIALGEALKSDTAVYAIDLHGNGQSGQPGDTPDRALHFRDLEALLTLVRSRHPGARHYLAGYSLGAAYAALWTARRPNVFSGLILFAAPFSNVLTPPPKMRAVFSVWARLMPTFRLGLRVPTEDGIDPRYVFAAQQSDFISKRTLRSLKVSMDVVPDSRKALPHVTLPTLILHGDADPVAQPAGARLAYDGLGAEDKTLHWIPGAQHDLYDVVSGFKSSAVTDEQRALVIRPVRDWLERH